MFEVIVVDNNSVDGTAELASRYSRRHRNFRYVFEKNQGLSHARNRGYSESKGEYLAYLDDDAKAPPEYLSTALEVIRSHDPDIFGGPVYPYYTETKPRWFKDEYEIRQHSSTSGFSKTCGISGSNYIIKKKLLKQLGLFDVRLGMTGYKLWYGEERKVVETYRKVTPTSKQRVYYALECYVLHHVPRRKMRMRYMLLRYYEGGRMNVLVKERAKDFGSLIRLVIGSPYHFAREIIRQVKSNGLLGVDLIEVGRHASFHLGRLVEASRQVIKKHFAS